jgi:hypothetical protein
VLKPGDVWRIIEARNQLLNVKKMIDDTEDTGTSRILFPLDPMEVNPIDLLEHKLEDHETLSVGLKESTVALNPLILEKRKKIDNENVMDMVKGSNLVDVEIIEE